mgnify:CR=1 FL=1
MVRLARAEVFSPDEVAIVHVINRVVRRCYLLGDDPVSGNNYDHRKGWIEDRLELLAGAFSIDLLAYLELLDWTARQLVPGKRGATPADTPEVLERLAISPSSWCELAKNFGRLFSNVAGQPRRIDATSSRQSGRRFYATPAARCLFETATSGSPPAVQRQRSSSTRTISVLTQ